MRNIHRCHEVVTHIQSCLQQIQKIYILFCCALYCSGYFHLQIDSYEIFNYHIFGCFIGTKQSYDFPIPLQWRHNGPDGVSNHQPHDCLLNCLFIRRSKKTSMLRVTGLCAGNSPWPVNSPHKWPVMQKMFPFDDVIMQMNLNLKIIGEYIYQTTTKQHTNMSIVCTRPEHKNG